MKVSFEIHYEEGSFNNYFYGYFAILVFTLDIIFAFNTAFYRKGILITDRIKIFKKYFLSNFVFDTIGVSSIIIVQIDSRELWDLGFVVRIFQLHSRLKKLNQFF